MPFAHRVARRRTKTPQMTLKVSGFVQAYAKKTENVCLEISEDLNPVILNGESYEDYK